MYKINKLFQSSLFFILLFSSFHAAAQYRNAVFFGDSLSDTGNVARDLGFNLPSPFYMNRITNGKVAIDYLAAAVGHTAEASYYNDTHNGGYNYAYSGGRIVGSDHEDLSQQVDAFLQRVAGKADNRSFYFFMMGGNDLRNIRGISDTTLAQTRINQTVATIRQQIARVYNAGARYIMVVNVPNIGNIPETREDELTTPGIMARATQYTRSYNELLRQEMNNFALQNSAAKIMYVDIFQHLENMRANAAQFGITNTTDACFVIEGGIPIYHPECDFDSFVYFDNLHPTAKTNKIIGDKLISEVIIPDFSGNTGGGTRNPDMAALVPMISLLLSED